MSNNTLNADQTQVNRDKQCPFLIRTFYKEGSHNRKEDFEAIQTKPIDHEVHLYAWQDTTLREITEMLLESIPEINQNIKRMGIFIIRMNDYRNISIQKAGLVYNHGKRSFDENKTMMNLNLQPGDYLDIALLQ